MNQITIKKLNQLALDLLIFIISYFAAFLISFEGIPDPIHVRQLLSFFPYIALARVLSFYAFSVYSIAWRYISLRDVLTIFKACLPVSGIVFLARILFPEHLAIFQLPLRVIALEFSSVLIGTLGVRMIRRLVHELEARDRYERRESQGPRKPTLLIGAGDAGNMVVKELIQRKDLGIDVVGFIDDDPKKQKTMLQGYKVLGNVSQIPQVAKKYGVAEAIICIANATSKQIRSIVDICEGINIKVKIIPALFEILGDKIKFSKIREINIDDLLGRSIVNFESHIPRIIQHYKDKKIMITGAGGSIGSELCRQLAKLWPRELILIDKDENSIYEIDSELTADLKNHKIHPIIVNIKNFSRMDHIFDKYRPDIVFHAAAHKHVPLMEQNIAEAILNNVVGTQNAASLADKYGIQNFVNISTDKAINPTSIMGASKKIGEIIVQDLARRSATKFSVVRFGNVLGSRGSAVPLFQRQIAHGGPITITHPDIRRYFMSISEAVQLIIQAGTIGDKGEIFVLDMGQPIKIVHLAQELIRLSGHKNEDIQIKYIGLRSGEKLYEEVLVDEEKDKATQFERIFIAPPINIDYDKFMKIIREIRAAAERNDDQSVLTALKDLDIGYARD